MPITLRPYRRFPVHSSVTDNPGPYLKLSLACFSCFWLLITFLLLSRGPANAEWEAIEDKYQSPGLHTVYIDSSTIKREGNLVTLWILTDYKWMQGNVGMGPVGFGPQRFSSTKTYKQSDCAKMRFRLLAYTEFSRHTGTGDPNDGYVDQDTWVPVEPESLNHGLWEVACGKPRERSP
jgi:surface-adhesin protein E